MGECVDRLKKQLTTIADLQAAEQVLSWDQQTFMPSGGTDARAQQLSTLASLAHDAFVAPQVEGLLEAAALEVETLDPDSVDSRLVHVTRRDHDRAAKLPAPLVAEIACHAAIANDVWVEARRTDDFPSFAPSLRRTVELSREIAEHVGYDEHMYDALVDEFEPGMKTAQVRATFTGLRSSLVPLVREIADRSGPERDGLLRQYFGETQQEAFGYSVLERYGFDCSRGRQDRSIHPFQTTFAVDDVRITTRFDPHYLGDALFSTLHECGHALYEQGIAVELDRSPLGTGVSLGVHESQSRLWENVVGRSRLFWQHFYPQLQATFPAQLASVPPDAFYAAINAVQPSFIRVDADEVTYNLHIMLRFEMELGLLSGDISVEEAPHVWNDIMESSLGIRPSSNTLGILQDSHWSSGVMGYFPTYTIGNILSVQFFDAAVNAHPEIPDEIGQGKFDTLRGWLTEHIYRYGAMFEPGELVERATGRPLTIEPYVAYLRKKYADLYGLS